MICGENGALKALEDAKDAIKGKIEEGMSALSDLEDQASEALKSLGEFKIELPELPDLQAELIKLQAEATNGLAFSVKLAEIKEQFGKAVEDLDETIKELGLDDFPPSLDFDTLKAKLCDIPNKRVAQTGEVVDKPKEPKEASTPAAEVPQKKETRPPKVTKKIILTEERTDYTKPETYDVAAAEAAATSTEGSTLRELMLQRESSGRYTVINRLGYLGGYQFGILALIDVGYIKYKFKAEGNSYMENDFVWTGLNGIKSRDDFLNNPDVQDAAFDAYASRNESILRNIGVITDATTPQEINGYVAAAHLLGAGGVKKGLDTVDANGVSGRIYYEIGLTAATTTSTVVEVVATDTFSIFDKAVVTACLRHFPQDEGEAKYFYWGFYYALRKDLPSNTKLRSFPLSAPPDKIGDDQIPDTHPKQYRDDYSQWIEGRYCGELLLGSYDQYRTAAIENGATGVPNFTQAVPIWNKG